MSSLSTPDTASLSGSNDEFSDDDINFVSPTGYTQSDDSGSIKIIQEVAKLLRLNETTVRLLLTAFHWDKEALIESYYDQDRNVEGLLKMYKINFHPKMVRPNRKSSKSFSLTTPTSASLFFFNQNSHPLEITDIISDDTSPLLCIICYDEFLQTDMRGLVCEHYFCFDCWNGYLSSKIIDFSGSDRILCPKADCNLVVDDYTVMDLIKNDTRLQLRFQRAICESYVSSNPKLCWCPGVDCGLLAEIKDSPPQMAVRCTYCGMNFCFRCGSFPHDPASCNHLSAWIRYIEKDEGNSLWIKSNTKDCPNCETNIEKNGGCNHMTCRKCNHEFCWICFGKWNEHGSCNKFDEEEANCDSARAELERYTHYLTRYEIHKRNIGLTEELLKQFTIRLRHIQEEGTIWIDESLVQKASETLQICRMTLMNSYVFAYNIMRTNQALIFEDNQADLEKSVENLSYLIENSSKVLDSSEFKRNLENLSKYCKQRNEVLNNHVKEGLLNDIWEFRNTVLTK